MQRLFVISLMITLYSLLLAQDPWANISVATPDNLNAISSNPAGLGIDRGSQNGTYIPFDSVFTIHSSSRFSGFGYDLTYQLTDGKFPNLFNPFNGNIGFGSALFRNAYIGLKWNKRHIIDIGFLYRPINLFSLGAAVQFNDDFKEYCQSTLGIAIRPLPLLKHRLTIGADLISLNNNDSLQIYPHLAIEPIDGISISAISNSNFDDFNINLAFNFGKETVYSPASINANSDYSGGIGFYSDTQNLASIFNKKSKDIKRFIRMKLDGLFIEEKPYDPPFSFDINFNPFSGEKKRGVQLRTWIDEIDKLTNNDEVDGLIIDMGEVQAGFAKRGEIYSALKRFKNTGKKIFVYAEKGISNTDYYLVSMADEIYLNEYTGVFLRGLRMEINFFRGLLDTLLIQPEVFRVQFDGKSYKTAGDQFLNKKMSDEMRESYGNLLDDFYSVYLTGISEGRGWVEDHTQEIIDNGPYFRPQDAIVAGLADSIMYPDQFDDYIKSLNDEKVEILKWQDIDRSDDYVHEWAPKKKEKIAIIYAVGGIVSGKSNPGPAGSSIMGDETISKAIKSAREDEDIKAILLRIDSGGGSALASDQMWREVLKTTDVETAKTKQDSANIKPFIASMSDVAASGGYYIACQADTIIAHPATVTGSIGVIGLRLNFSKLMHKWGITSDLIKRGEFSDFLSGNRLTTEAEREKIQDSINDTYSKFKDRVIKGRTDMTEDQNLDDVAMGRVFSGKRAKDDISIPLVDVTGGLHDSIELTKYAAGLDGKEIEIVEYPMTGDKFKKLTNSFTHLRSTDYTQMLPEKLAREFEIFDAIPVLINNEVQLLLPYNITIE